MDLVIALVAIAVWTVLVFTVGRVYEANRQRKFVEDLIEQDNLTREAWDQISAGL